MDALKQTAEIHNEANLQREEQPNRDGANAGQGAWVVAWGNTRNENMR